MIPEAKDKVNSPFFLFFFFHGTDSKCPDYTVTRVEKKKEKKYYANFRCHLISHGSHSRGREPDKSDKVA